MWIFRNWQAKIGSIVLALIFYVNLQHSKVLVKNINIPIEYPRLSQNYSYGKNLEKTFPVRIEGFRDYVNYHSQFLKVVINAQDLLPGENQVESIKIAGIPASGLKVTKLGEKINIFVEQVITKTVPIEPDFEDNPPEEFIKSSHSIRPTNVIISGNKNILDKINKINTQKISLKEYRQSFTTRVKLSDLPKGVNFVSPNREYTLKVNITRVSLDAGEQIVTIPVKCEGLDNALDVDLSHEEVTIKFNTTSALTSLQIVQGITATVPCNYSYDKKIKKILPNSNPVVAKVRVIKSNDLRPMQILNVIPEKITIQYTIKKDAEVEEKPEEEIYYPEPPTEVPR